MAPEMGATPKGSAWCMKALHPSDASVEVGGIPDKSAIPSVMINYQSTARYGAPAGTTEPTWNFASTMLPHPVAFGVACPVSSDGHSVGNFTPFLNEQLAGADHSTKMASFLAQAERWRLAYLGVSIHFEGPALSNQGSITVNQAPFAPRQYHACGIGPTAEGSLSCSTALPTICTNDVDPADLPSSPEFPSYDRSISMPNAYQGEIKDGAYIPLKLTKTCQQWLSKADLQYWTFPDGGALTDGKLSIPTSPATMSFPFAGLERLYQAPSPLAALVGGYVTSPLCSDVVAHVCGRNISVSSALIFTFRVGFEVQVEPGSLLSPYQRLSPEYDPVALKAYFMVARQLKDAYPVSYNDLGRLWDVISGGLELASPVLSVIHPALGGVANAIRHGGNAIRTIATSKAKGPDAKGSTQALAAIEANRAATAKATEAMFAKLVARANGAASAKKARKKKAAPAKKQSGGG